MIDEHDDYNKDGVSVKQTVQLWETPEMVVNK